MINYVIVLSTFCMQMCYGLRSSVTRMDDVTTSEMFMMQPDLCTLIIPLTKLVLQFGWRKVAVISFGGDPLGYVRI